MREGGALTEPEAQRIADRETVLSDPSPLTTANLLREIRHLRELLESTTASIEADVAKYKEDHEAKHKEVVAASTSHLHDLMGARFKETEVRLSEMDNRYNQRYVAQGQAVDAAFSNAQLATQAALAAADKAVISALASAEMAVHKAEALNEKRFETLTRSVAAASLLAPDHERLKERIEGFDSLTDAKFVTFRTLIDSQADKVALALAASDKAVSKAEVANEKRFESVNEFRKTLSDQSHTFIARTEASAAITALADRVDAALRGVDIQVADLKGRLDRAEGRSGGFSSSGAILVAAVGFLATLISIVTGIILVLN